MNVIGSRTQLAPLFLYVPASLPAEPRKVLAEWSVVNPNIRLTNDPTCVSMVVKYGTEWIAQCVARTRQYKAIGPGGSWADDFILLKHIEARSGIMVAPTYFMSDMQCFDKHQSLDVYEAYMGESKLVMRATQASDISQLTPQANSDNQLLFASVPRYYMKPTPGEMMVVHGISAKGFNLIMNKRVPNDVFRIVQVALLYALRERIGFFSIELTRNGGDVVLHQVTLGLTPDVIMSNIHKVPEFGAILDHAATAWKES